MTRKTFGLLQEVYHMDGKGRPMTYATVYKKHKTHFFSKPERVAVRVPICPHCKNKRLRILSESHSPHDSLGDTVYYKCLRCRFRFFSMETEHGERAFPQRWTVTVRKTRIIRRKKH